MPPRSGCFARHAVADQVLGLLAREIVERLQHHDLELQDRVIGLAAGVALALLGLPLRDGLNVRAEILPSHDLLDRLQRVTLGANRIQPALNIEKSLLPHDSLAPSARCRVWSPSQIRADLARGIFRGALYRIGTDPRRLVFQYIRDAWRFPQIVAREWLRLRRNRRRLRGSSAARG
jgi:hypothetical protein